MPEVPALESSVVDEATSSVSGPTAGPELAAGSSTATSDTGVDHGVGVAKGRGNPSESGIEHGTGTAKTREHGSNAVSGGGDVARRPRRSG